MNRTAPGIRKNRVGLREKRKLETRERIRIAAAELFTRHGYGAATMRQIARRAHVGLGTLFNYAEDKRDLVFLIFNEELNAVTDVALAAPRSGQALAEQLLAVFRVHYRWLATKPALALQLLEQLQTVDGLPKVVVVDAGYGVDTAFRQKLTTLGFTYVVGITGAVSVWPEGQAPLPPKPWAGRGLKPTRLRRDAEHQPLSARALAMQLPPRRLHTVTWREGTNQALSSRFAALRVRCAHRDHLRIEPHPEQWLLIEWPRGEAEPSKYFLTTLPAATPLKELVRVAKLRWRIERDYQELKQELGLGHFEGRSWRGFHHHATLCIAAYAFLLAQRIAAPKKTLPHPMLGEIPALPEGFRPRGSPAKAAPRSRLDHDATPGTRRRLDRKPRSVPVLQSESLSKLLTQ